MKISHVGILLLLTTAAVSLTGCSYINQVWARDQLNDGAKAYKERKFDEAEKHFRRAMDLDPSEKRTELFLARTLHQQYLTKRDSPENIKKGEQAIDIYKRLLEEDPNDTASNDAISNLLLNLKGPDAQLEWMKKRSEDARVKPQGRAQALTLLASKDYTCANEITESPDVKSTVQKGNEAIFVFKKPANNEDFEKAKQCIAKGMATIDKALALDQESDSTWSYKASLAAQQARIAEMEGNTAEKERSLSESKKARARSNEITAEKARLKEEKEKRDADEAAAKQ